ncbi:hypothetical protein [Mesorhizobium sp. M0998]|uniref:antitoxin Xre/MbcA/ParS-like domain-containing protein n=1 Tax=Mesorhizobium sp. M0998 TaxID=2957044 RepID=UPI00333C490C
MLARQGKVTNSDAVVAAGRVAGAVAAAVALLAPTDISAIDTMQERLPGMASRFVRILAAEAAERRARTHLSTAHEGQGADIQRLAGTGDLDAMRVEDWAGRVAGSTFLQQNLGISRSTLHRWQRSGTVVALRTGGRKTCISPGPVHRRQAGAGCQGSVIRDARSTACLVVADRPRARPRRTYSH